MRQETNDVFQETLNSYSCTLHGLIRDAVIVTTCMTKKEITKKPASFPWSCHLWNSHLERLRKKGSGGKMIFKMTISFLSHLGYLRRRSLAVVRLRKITPESEAEIGKIAFGPWKSPSLEPTVHRCYRMVPCANLQLPPEVDKCELNLTDCQGGGRNIGLEGKLFWYLWHIYETEIIEILHIYKGCLLKETFDWLRSIQLELRFGALVATELLDGWVAIFEEFHPGLH